MERAYARFGLHHCALERVWDCALRRGKFRRRDTQLAQRTAIVATCERAQCGIAVGTNLRNDAGDAALELARACLCRPRQRITACRRIEGTPLQAAPAHRGPGQIVGGVVIESHAPKLLSGALAGLLLLGVWLYLVLSLSRRELSLAVELQQAIARGDIRVRYQPVINLATGKCVGAEALARWSRESGEPVSPDVFIPVAEENGLIRDVTLSVLHSTVRDLQPVLSEFPHGSPAALPS